MVVASEGKVSPALEGFAGASSALDDVDYDGARRIYNALIDKRLVARCAVSGHRRHRGVCLDRSGRGLGAVDPGWWPRRAGRALTDGGLTIDLSRMKGIHVDPHNETVRAQPGVN